MMCRNVQNTQTERELQGRTHANHLLKICEEFPLPHGPFVKMTISATERSQ